MAKKEEAKEPEAKVEPEAETPKPEAKPEEVKPEEKPQITKEEYEQLLARLEKSDSRWETAQGIINKQKEEIGSLKDNQDLWKVLIGMNAERQGISDSESEEDLKKRKPDLLQQFTQVQQGLDAKRRQDKFMSYGPIVEELGLKEGDDDFEIIYSLAAKGKWEKADKKIAAIRAKKTEQPESKEAKVESKETPEEIEKRIREDERKKVLEEKGLLEPEGAEPSATAAHSLAEVAQEYAENPTEANRKRYEEAVSKQT